MSGIRFHVNGKEHIVPQSFHVTTSLNEYLRESAGLKGTKVMCKEVDGWQISTIEGIGSQRKGYHPIQERIAKFNGTQCGYCTPGMVMNMYGLLHQKPNITAQEVEDNFDGNICRCTGYRSILDAMKSFAGNANIPDSKAIDIEDLNKNLCSKTGEACTGKCGQGLDLRLNDAHWHRPTSLDQIGEVMKDNKHKKIRLVFGNTSTGIYKDDGPYDVYIDLHGVKELYSYEVNGKSVRLGAATTLTQVIERLKANHHKPGFKYFSDMSKHLKVVANVMVRNGGCIAGNLMIKYWHKEFPSDVFLMLECAGAKVEIFSSTSGKKETSSMMDFLNKVDMTDRVLTAVILPCLADNVVYRSFKITPRWQNAHAYVNAAFNIPIEGLVIKGRPSVVLGGISADTVHATKTEDFLANKTLSPAVLKEAYSTLRDELVPTENPQEASPKYRKDLASGLLYKVLLSLQPSKSSQVRSGVEDLHRPTSSGLQTYQEMTHDFPIHKGLPKKEAAVQAAGEAVFVNDMPKFQNELYAVFVLADVASATIESIDASEALKLPGVTHFFSAKDIIGENNYMYGGSLFSLTPHELKRAIITELSSGEYCHPIVFFISETQAMATTAAKLVKVTYSKIRTPVLSVEESLAKDMEFKDARITEVVGSPDEAWKTVDQKVEGTIKMGSQYHFYMETQVSLAVPSEDSIDVYSSTQNLDACQDAAAQIIGKPLNFINITVPRLGGGFGGKVFEPAMLTAASSLAAYLSDQPVRLNVDLASCIRIFGKRQPFVAKYKAGFTQEGDVKVVDVEILADSGYTDHGAMFTHDCINYMDMGYFVPNWNIVGKVMQTNKKSMMPTRAPGTVPGALIIESIMENVAKTLNKHPVFVKEINLYRKGQKDIMGHTLNNCTIREVWRRLKDIAEVEGRLRQVEAYNQENKWKKRAITMTTSKHHMHHYGPGLGATVTIYGRDGSVAVTQGGVEMGQGLYTKVAQGVAHVLGVPWEIIKVKPMQGISSPNSMISGGSIASESAMQAAIGAAQILKERMQPIREKFPDADWKELCQRSEANKLDLSARFFNRHELGDPLANYHTYCAGVIETEVDILTGESQIGRVDIMADYGESLNPVIDIGQTEGAFIMGVGCFLTEDTKFDKETGRILTDGTWNYKPPTTKDIPIDWRIHLLPDSPNPFGIRSSKASGEPAIALATGALLANKQALEAARKDLFGVRDFIPVDAPFTPEKAQQSVGLDESVFAV
ncbi:xanthine dehydrogenase/oxidase [Plakobranchus ocellatus]|uniref:Xanthine dehydrogenase/oxidase n=1 Tax=Plakobranchus ocellatus TaxID=259542 RepID=A0AAV4BEZ1_9GAST|nr:xanthine dehydrogenase/oxidase [Plakobranchus ocellatus]